MARPLPTGKQSVNLSAPGVRVSRIRRDPPPKVKEVDPAVLAERERQATVIGVILFALAIVAIIWGMGSYNGWSLRDYTAHI